MKKVRGFFWTTVLLTNMSESSMDHVATATGQFKAISMPNLRPCWYYSPNKPPFTVRSGEVALNCPLLYCSNASGFADGFTDSSRPFRATLLQCGFP